MVQTATGMSRGMVVLDENLFDLYDGLKSKNIKVLKPKTGTSDEEIAEYLASGRIIITKNSKFIDFAPEHEFGIIAVERMHMSSAELASIISRAISTRSLWSQPRAFILYLDPSGKHEFKLLE